MAFYKLWAFNGLWKPVSYSWLFRGCWPLSLQQYKLAVPQERNWNPIYGWDWKLQRLKCQQHWGLASPLIMSCQRRVENVIPRLETQATPATNCTGLGPSWNDEEWIWKPLRLISRLPGTAAFKPQCSSFGASVGANHEWDFVACTVYIWL